MTASSLAQFFTNFLQTRDASPITPGSPGGFSGRKTLSSWKGPPEMLLLIRKKEKKAFLCDMRNQQKQKPPLQYERSAGRIP